MAALGDAVAGRAALAGPAGRDRAIARAASLEEKGKEDAALRLLSQVLERHPDSVPALTAAARLLAARGDAEGARSLLARSSELDPEGSAERHLLLGHLETGRAAANAFQAALVLLSRDEAALRGGWDGHSGAGRAGGGQGKGADAALAACRRQQGAAHAALAKVFLTDLAHEPGAQAEAERALDRALRHDPESPDACQALSDLRLSQGRPGEARLLARRAAELCAPGRLPAGVAPSFDFALVTARLLLECGDAEAAAELLADLAEEACPSLSLCPSPVPIISLPLSIDLSIHTYFSRSLLSPLQDPADVEVWYLLGLARLGGGAKGERGGCREGARGGGGEGGCGGGLGGGLPPGHDPGPQARVAAREALERARDLLERGGGGAGDEAGADPALLAQVRGLLARCGGAGGVGGVGADDDGVESPLVDLGLARAPIAAPAGSSGRGGAGPLLGAGADPGREGVSAAPHSRRPEDVVATLHAGAARGGAPHAEVDLGSAAAAAAAAVAEGGGAARPDPPAPLAPTSQRPSTVEGGTLGAARRSLSPAPRRLPV